MNSFFSLGSSRPITEEDLWKPAPENQAATFCKAVEKAWNNELKTKSPSIGRAFFNANKHWILQIIVYQCSMFLLQFSVPIVMGYFIDWFSDPQNDELPKIVNFDVDGYIWAALFSFLSFLCAFQHYPFYQYQQVKGSNSLKLFYPRLFKLGHQMRVQACYLLHKKILKISESGSSEFSIGKLINFMSNDAQRYEFFARVVPFAIMAPFAITVGIWQIYSRVGNAAFVTLGTLIFLTMERVDQIKRGWSSRWSSSVWCHIPYVTYGLRAK